MADDNQVRAICSTCFAAYAHSIEDCGSGLLSAANSAARQICICGGRLVTPEVDMDAKIHYEIIKKASLVVNSADHINMGTIH